MGLQKILEAIQASGEAQVREIEEQTQTRIREILAEAGMQAQRIEEEACLEATLPAFGERARIVHRARLEALQSIGHARETQVDTALDRARGYLADMRHRSTYPLILRRLIIEALAGLEATLEEGSQARLEADPKDRTILERIILELGLNLPVEYPLDTWGGVVVKSLDERVVVVNTLETRFERSLPYLRRYLAATFEADKVDAMAHRSSEPVPAIKTMR